MLNDQVITAIGGASVHRLVRGIDMRYYINISCHRHENSLSVLMCLTGEVSEGSASAGPTTHNTVANSSSDEEVFDDGYDDQLMGDEEDRRKLEQMTQVEREKIIFERLERRDVLRTRYVQNIMNSSNKF